MRETQQEQDRYRAGLMGPAALGAQGAGSVLSGLMVRSPQDLNPRESKGRSPGGAGHDAGATHAILLSPGPHGELSRCATSCGEYLFL